MFLLDDLRRDPVKTRTGIRYVGEMCNDMLEKENFAFEQTHSCNGKYFILPFTRYFSLYLIHAG